MGLERCSGKEMRMKWMTVSSSEAVFDACSESTAGLDQGLRPTLSVSTTLKVQNLQGMTRYDKGSYKTRRKAKSINCIQESIFV